MVQFKSRNWPFGIKMNRLAVKIISLIEWCRRCSQNACSTSFTKVYLICNKAIAVSIEETIERNVRTQDQNHLAKFFKLHFLFRCLVFLLKCIKCNKCKLHFFAFISKNRCGISYCELWDDTILFYLSSQSTANRLHSFYCSVLFLRVS